MARVFQCVIGEETSPQLQAREGRLPDSLYACIASGSNAFGLFHPFLIIPPLKFFRVEAAGLGLGKKQQLPWRAGGPAFSMATGPIC
jgi:tryptophan synthase beta chain